MAQPNVAREPSMDEILASIRRIIESNEPPAGGQAAFAPIAPEDDISAGDDSFEEEVIVADLRNDRPSFDRTSFDRAVFDRSPFERAPVEAPAQAAPMPAPAIEPETRAQPAMSLADVAARVRAASERNGMFQREQPARPAPAPDGSRAETTFPAPSAAAAPAAADTAPEPAPSAPSIAEPAQTQPLPSVALAAAASRGQLMSPDIGAKVADAFGALAEAVEAGPRRSFDEIAEDMLRPMLQEWLDDNLPTLVERLVREEIERVARGPRR